MTQDRCQQYLEDPEAHPTHAAECASCRAVAEELRGAIEPRAAGVQPLPLAPWEGASHRSWPLVAGVVLTVVAMAAAFFAAAGVSPRAEIGRALSSSVASTSAWASFLSSAGGALQHAPASLQILIAVSFLLVNALLIVLLRRAPRGIDV